VFAGGKSGVIPFSHGNVCQSGPKPAFSTS